MPLVAGIHSSTQSCKIVVCEADTGAVVREARASHPDGTEVHPDAWWEALTQASADLFEGVEAVSVAGQQHGMVTIDGHGEVLRPTLLWNDTRSAAAAAELHSELGVSTARAAAVVRVPTVHLTAAELRSFAVHHP